MFLDFGRDLLFIKLKLIAFVSFIAYTSFLLFLSISFLRFFLVMTVCTTPIFYSLSMLASLSIANYSLSDWFRCSFLWIFSA